MSTRPRVGVLGGTFDPVHRGHLAAARAAQQAVELDSVRFIPAARPPHRTDSPRASGYHRLEMLRLAVAEEIHSDRAVRWEVSDLELRRDGPSFTFDTLEALHREGLTPLQVFFIIGADAFAEIAAWHRYPDVLDSANFVAVARRGTTLQSLAQRLPALASRMTQLDHAPDRGGLRVILIESDTPDVSSTDIRRRAAHGQSLTHLVPPIVAAYITQHSLYRSDQSSPVSGAPAVDPDPGR